MAPRRTLKIPLFSWVLLLAVACGDNTGGSGTGSGEATTDASATSTEGTGEISDSSTAGAGTDDATDSQTTDGATEGGTDTGTDTEGAEPECDDGVLAPHELCFTEESVVLGGQPSVVIAADIDLDGAVDLATANFAGQNTGLLWGHGDATFTVEQLYSGQGHRDVAVGDLDGDGVLDVLLTNVLIGYVSVHRGLGDRSFSALTPTAAGPLPRRLVLRDFNDDGILDLIVISEDPGDDQQTGLVIRAGDGAGEFEDAQAYEVGARPYDLAVGDVDDDGVLDVVVADYVNDGMDFYSQVRVRRGSGSGGLTADVQIIDVPGGTRRVILADWTGDGALDILTASFETDVVAILPNLGGGVFHDDWIPLQIGANEGVYDVAVTDINDDGNVDLISVHRDISMVTVLAGDGQGSVDAAGYWFTDLYPLSVAVADLDGDGWRDMAVANSFAGSISVLRANP